MPNITVTESYINRDHFGDRLSPIYSYTTAYTGQQGGIVWHNAEYGRVGIYRDENTIEAAAGLKYISHELINRNSDGNYGELSAGFICSHNESNDDFYTAFYGNISNPDNDDNYGLFIRASNGIVCSYGGWIEATGLGSGTQSAIGIKTIGQSGTVESIGVWGIGQHYLAGSGDLIGGKFEGIGTGGTENVYGIKVSATGGSGTKWAIYSDGNVQLYNLPVLSTETKMLYADTNGNLALGDIPAGGDLSKYGSPSGNQIAIWHSSTEVKGDSRFVWDDTYYGVVIERDYTSLSAPMLYIHDSDAVGSEDNVMVHIDASSRVTGSGDYLLLIQDSSNTYFSLLGNGQLTLKTLAGTGTRWVTATSAGVLGTDTISYADITDFASGVATYETNYWFEESSGYLTPQNSSGDVEITGNFKVDGVTQMNDYLDFASDIGIRCDPGMTNMFRIQAYDTSEAAYKDMIAVYSGTVPYMYFSSLAVDNDETYLVAVDPTNGLLSRRAVSTIENTVSYGSKSSAVDAGTLGELSVDDDYLYICVVAGGAGSATWKRLALMIST